MDYMCEKAENVEKCIRDEALRSQLSSILLNSDANGGEVDKNRLVKTILDEIEERLELRLRSIERRLDLVD